MIRPFIISAAVMVSLPVVTEAFIARAHSAPAASSCCEQCAKSGTSPVPPLKANYFISSGGSMFQMLPGHEADCAR